MRRVKLILMALRLILLEKEIIKKQQVLSDIYLKTKRLNSHRAIKISKVLDKLVCKFEKQEILFIMARYEILYRESKKKVEELLLNEVIQATIHSKI